MNGFELTVSLEDAVRDDKDDNGPLPLRPPNSDHPFGYIQLDLPLPEPPATLAELRAMPGEYSRCLPPR